MFTAWLEQYVWQSRNIVSWMLLPFSAVYFCIISIRKFFFQKTAYSSALPVIVVGNISVGGNGKTPVLIAIAKFFN